MAVILQIDASARRQRSLSRGLAQAFAEQWRARHPQDEFIYRDVGTRPPGFISQPWIEAVFTPPDDRNAQQNALLAESDQLIAELEAADLIVIATPMYNYGMPAALKAWIDQIVRVDRTFTFDLSRGDFPLEPVLSGKTLVLLTACGEFGFGEGGIRQTMNHLGPHLHTLRRYLGVDSIHEVAIEYQEFRDNRHQQSVASAHLQLPTLIAQLSGHYHPGD